MCPPMEVVRVSLLRYIDAASSVARIKMIVDLNSDEASENLPWFRSDWEENRFLEEQYRNQARNGQA